ncbi:ribbon-helix-helix domain-containing protein [Floridanema evergladense]|uniref:CopG-like ribbon-helix-helix domain-containing protein n=1 Tax=Floridaenema evergladense BLCC-F167 TaxID=3153639 RepID=A0ABV4WHH2_9CYAN
MLEAQTEGLDDLMVKPRITITVSEEVYQVLVNWAEEEERPLANLVAYIVSKTAKEHQEQQQKESK